MNSIFAKLPGKHYIDGKWIKGKGDGFNSLNPATQESLWQGNNATSEEVGRAMAAASKAVDWSMLDFQTRAGYVRRFADIVEANRQTLAEIISLETGKPLWESLTEVSSVVGKIAISIKAYLERNNTVANETADATAWIRYKPYGVVVVLGAFNFPAHLSNGHIVPALLAGNRILYKPSELAPGVAAFIMQCWHDCGLPAGVINCLQGNSSTAQEILNNDIHGVYFTGSYQTGKRIHQQFSDRPEVILALEMGGNNPLVVDKVDDVDAAVYMTVLSTMITAGQRCTCARRVFIPESKQGDLFLQKLIKTCQQLVVGAYTSSPEPFMGTVIRLSHAQHHLQTQEGLLTKGGDSLLKMQLLADNAALLSPGIIDMTSAKKIDDEEIFAPLTQIFRYQNFEDAIAQANNSKYGLAAGLLSNNPENYEFFYRNIRSGLINWNRPTTGAASSLPFGGVGCSGNNRPSAYFAADYCSYPIASMENPSLVKPGKYLPGIRMDE